MSSIIKFKCKEQKIVDGKLEDTGREPEYCVRQPTLPQQREGQKVYNRALNDALSSGAILREKIDEVLESQGLWDEDKRTELKELGIKIARGEKKLSDGGFDFDEAVKLAKDIRKWRLDVLDLMSVRSNLDALTAQGQADQARFNYYASVCLVYNDDQKQVFSSLEDFIDNNITEQAATGSSKLAELIYGVSDDFESQNTEIQFLREFKLVDEKNRYINEDGHLIDEQGRLIDEEGFFVLPDGSRCDIDGNKTDDSKERKPFTRNGKPMNSVEPKKKPGRPKKTDSD